jgi:hypothetical protein
MPRLDPVKSKPVIKLPGSVTPQQAAKPAPAPPRPTPTTFSQPAPSAVDTIENSPLWANITTDTPKPKSASHTDTERNNPPYKPASATLESARRRAAAPTKSGGMRWILLIAAGVLIGAMIVGAILAFGLLTSRKVTSTPSGSRRAQVTQTLIVDASAKPDYITSFTRVSQAASKAKSGDVIRVRSPVEEVWTGFAVEKLAKDLTIEADLPAGQYIPWRLPANPVDTTSVLYLKNCHGWKFKGFEFDGQGKAANAIYITLHCPGLTFENCRASNCTDSAIKLSNVSGDSDRPVTFTHFRATGHPAGKSAVTLFALPTLPTNKANEHIAFHDGIIDGPCNALVTIDGSAEDVVFRRNRFFQSSDGIVIKPIKANQSCRVNVNANSFARIAKSAILVESAPVEPNLSVENNLFANCQNVMTSASGKPPASLVSRNNVRDATSLEGNGKLEIRVMEVKWQSENPADERRFLRYAKDSPLNAKPLGPVGVPPLD